MRACSRACASPASPSCAPTQLYVYVYLPCAVVIAPVPVLQHCVLAGASGVSRRRHGTCFVFGNPPSGPQRRHGLRWLSVRHMATVRRRGAQPGDPGGSGGSGGPGDADDCVRPDRGSRAGLAPDPRRPDGPASLFHSPLRHAVSPIMHHHNSFRWFQIAVRSAPFVGPGFSVWFWFGAPSAKGHGIALGYVNAAKAYHISVKQHAKARRSGGFALAALPRQGPRART